MDCIFGRQSERFDFERPPPAPPYAVFEHVHPLQMRTVFFSTWKLMFFQENLLTKSENERIII